MRRLKPLLLRILSATRIVDDAYYKLKYRDVATSGLDTSYHYFRYGFFENRHPNRTLERFAIWRKEKSTALLIHFFLNEDFYLRTYRDAREEGISAAEHYAKKGRSERRNLNQVSQSLDDFLFFFKLELKRRAGTGSPSESDIANYKYILFETARHGVFSKLKTKAISRQLNAENADSKIMLGKFGTMPYTGLTKAGHSLEMIEPAYSMSFREPEVIGSAAERPIRSAQVPEKWIALIKNATITAGFQVLAGSRLVIYEPAADPHKGFVAGIWQYIVSLNQKNEILLWFRYKKEATLSAAILLSGRCSPNYYHWLVEYLGKSYILSRKSGLNKIPLIVDDGMFPQEFESLQALLPDWPIYRLDDSTRLKVKQLYVPSSCTNLADNLREPMWKSSAICFRTLAHMQSAVFKQFNIDPEGRGSRKVFLARRTGRNIVNTPDIEAILASFDYEIVDTGGLSFEDQVRLFADASVIVGAMGAAHTNLIFCRPGTRVLALSSPYTQLFCSQSNMALFSGCSYRILAGQHPRFRPGDESTVSDPNLFLDSYTIDPDELTEALSEIELQEHSEPRSRPEVRPSMTGGAR